MKAAFSPPPQAAAAAAAPSEIVEEAILGDASAPQAHPIASEVATVAGDGARQPAAAGGSKPIVPSLLEPMDSSTAEVVKQTLEQDPKADAAQAKQPAPTLAAAAAEEAPPRRARKPRGPAPNSDSLADRPPRRRASTELMRSGGAAEGADSLEVRSVTLANGKQASLILEEGKLQRIMASDGQVTELRWNAPERAGGERAVGPQRLRPLAVKMHRGATPGATSTGGREAPEGRPGALKRWADSLSSQRLTSGSGAPSRKASLMSAPGGWDAPNGRVRADGQPPRASEARRGRMASLFSLPGKAADKGPQKEGAGAADMPTILETRREAQREWNPMHESWLPATMTQHPAAQGGGSKQLHTAPASAAQGGGGAPPQARHSMDVPPGSSGLAYGRESPEARPAIHSGQAGQMTAIYDSDPGYGELDSKRKFRLWRALKRLLHLPSVSKPRSPRSPRSPRAAGVRPGTPQATPRGRTGSKGEAPGKLRSFGLQSLGSIRRLSQGFGGGKVKAPAELRDEDFTADPLGSGASPLRSLPESPGELRTVGSETDVFRPKAAAASSPAERDVLGRGRQVDSFVPPTPQQLPGRGAPRQGASPAGEESEDLQLSPPRTLASNPAPRLTNADLIDTTELRAALASRRSARAQQAREAGAGAGGEEEGRSRSRGRRLSDTLERLPRQRTMLAGRWRKNFTEGVSGAKVDELLQVSSLQRLARERIVELEIVETEETFEMSWHIPLNGSASKISKTDRYLKNGEVVEAARRDGRAGVLRSQLTFTPEGHVHIRALQGEPFSAVFHDRIKLSTGGRRIKLEQKFQLLQPGVLPVKHHSIWTRVE